MKTIYEIHCDPVIANNTNHPLDGIWHSLITHEPDRNKDMICEEIADRLQERFGFCYVVAIFDTVGRDIVDSCPMEGYFLATKQ